MVLSHSIVLQQSVEDQSLISTSFSVVSSEYEISPVPVGVSVQLLALSADPYMLSMLKPGGIIKPG